MYWEKLNHYKSLLHATYIVNIFYKSKLFYHVNSLTHHSNRYFCSLKDCICFWNSISVLRIVLCKGQADVSILTSWFDKTFKCCEWYKAWGVNWRTLSDITVSISLKLAKLHTKYVFLFFLGKHFQPIVRPDRIISGQHRGKSYQLVLDVAPAGTGGRQCWGSRRRGKKRYSATF